MFFTINFTLKYSYKYEEKIDFNTSTFPGKVKPKFSSKQTFQILF